MPTTTKDMPPNTAVVERCIYGIAHGDAESLRVLYEQTSGAVYAYALSITKNVFDAKDILHDCIVKVYESAGSYVSHGKPMAWILTIAKNLCYTKFRQNSRFCEMTDEAIEGHFADNDRMSADDKIVVTQCLSRLAEDERKIVVLHAVSGLKHRDIAKLTDIPISTVISKYNRAIKKLQKIFAEN
ncbi:MAG: RNA polymerase sigma factor [Corallococcus sp.]|nr:RNA polymerase sigma factor [Corallococcus sp.]MCM1359789.1 RNA polymerase sigma factor [Corallococcus sp.]MCM1395685.1 RNA polymerase sigma factor [Corallococcus sp.]